MKKALVAVLVVAGIVIAAPHVWQAVSGGAAARISRDRVQRILDGMAEGDEQLAISAWAQDKIVMQMDDLRIFQPRFERFWKSSGLADQSGWAITEVEVDEDGDGVWITVSAAGQSIDLWVPPRSPIELADE